MEGVNPKRGISNSSFFNYSDLRKLVYDPVNKYLIIIDNDSIRTSVRNSLPDAASDM